MQRTLTLGLVVWVLALSGRSTPAAHPSTQLGPPRAQVEGQAPATGGPQYAADDKLVRPAGTFRLLIQNTTNLNDVDFDIIGDTNAKVKDVPINARSGKRRSELLTLTSGKYKLRVQSQPKLTMDIEIGK